MTDSNDQFAKLEEKILKTIELVKRVQAEKHALEQDLERLRIDSKDQAKFIDTLSENRSLEQRVETLKTELKEREKLTDTLEREIVALRREREDVRARIEKVVRQIDVLTSSDSEG